MLKNTKYDLIERVLKKHIEQGSLTRAAGRINSFILICKYY